MSEKDVKDNETEALNNDAAENADIEAGETDMATSIESVDFAVVYDDGGDSIATESAENAENTEGIATEDSVASDNANRVNETLALGATDDEQSLDQHETVQADSATSVSSQIDREIKHHRKKDAFFFKANPTFALDHVTVHNRKTGRDVLDDVSLAFHAGATHAVLVDAEDVEQHQALVATMVGNLIDAYRVSISSSAWLGEETKQKALEKLSKFVPKIGYTNHWRDYSALDVREDAGFAQNMRAANLYETGYQLAKVGKAVDKDEWLMNPQTVNAYYEPSMNVIVFPAAILQPPFFNPDAEDAANYGGIGAVIGHEIGHGFDDQGSQYDGDGKLNDWWTEEDKANFKALTQKLIDQYNEFVPTQLAEKYSDDPSKAPHVNGALTIGENIGDLSGVNIALKAYAFALDEAAGRGKDGSTEAIEAALADAPEIDGFTGLQRFFLSYASIWRTKNRDELAEQYLQIDPHSPAECRTNGIARNVDLFHKAFGVQPGDGMWLAPEQRVRIW